MNAWDVQLVDSMGSDRSIVRAARVSRLGDSDEASDAEVERLIRYMLKHGHSSPFEHVVLTFRISIPKYAAVQWMRHRTWAYNEVSRRYTSERVELQPSPVWREQATTNKQASGAPLANQGGPAGVYQHVSVVCLNAYHDLIARGVSREQARMVLPQAMMTEFYGTVSLHNLFGFLRQRLASDSQKEIREPAEECLKLARTVAPVAVRIWEEFRA